MKTAAEIRAALNGPVPTVRTPFRRDGTLDYPALRNMIEFMIGAGAKAVVLTAGDSHLLALSDPEIADLTKAVTEQVRNRALVVAADRSYDTKHALSFADYAAGVGADVLMVLPPDWAASCTPESLAIHYAAVARRIPVMLVTNLFIPRGAAFGLETIRRALDLSPNIVSIKDDMVGDFARKLGLLAHERCALWAGGQKQNHLNMAPYGCTGYLSTFLTFKPEIAWAYWKAWVSGDLPGAVSVIRNHDMPFFQAVSGCVGGFDAGIHAVLELKGLAGRWRPQPYHSLTDAEMERLKGLLAEQGIL